MGRYQGTRANRFQEEETAAVRGFQQQIGGQSEVAIRGAPYPLAVWDERTGRLTPGFEEFARQMAYGRGLKEAWGDAFPNERYQPGIAKNLSCHPLITARVSSFHLAKLKAESAQHREVLDAKGITYDWIIQKAAETVLLGQGHTILSRDAETGEMRVIEGKQDLGASIRALELLGRERGMFVEHRKVTREGSFGDLSDDELDAQIDAARRSQGIQINVTVNGNAADFRSGPIIDADMGGRDGAGGEAAGTRALAGARTARDEAAA